MALVIPVSAWMAGGIRLRGLTSVDHSDTTSPSCTSTTAISVTRCQAGCAPVVSRSTIASGASNKGFKPLPLALLLAAPAVLLLLRRLSLRLGRRVEHPLEGFLRAAVQLFVAQVDRVLLAFAHSSYLSSTANLQQNRRQLPDREAENGQAGDHVDAAEQPRSDAVAQPARAGRQHDPPGSRTEEHAQHHQRRGAVVAGDQSQAGEDGDEGEDGRWVGERQPERGEEALQQA